MNQEGENRSEASLASENKPVLDLLAQDLVLDENQTIYKLLVDSVKDYAIFMLNATGHIITWNEGAQRIKGYSKEEILNKHFSIFYTQEALQRDHPAYELKVATSTGRFEEEGWRVRKDGSLFWANVVISAVFNSKKELVGFSKVTRDLTERKNLEEKLLLANEELRESEERARLLIASIKDYAIYMLTPEGLIASWNEGAKRIKGYEEREILGSHFSKFYTRESASAGFPQFELERALSDGRFEDEGWRVRKDGSLFWANVIISPVYNEHKEHIGFTKVTRDLTERVRNEALMRKNMDLHRLNTDLDNFIYTASHDLKSPISNLEGLLSLVTNKISPKLDASEQQIIQMMESSVLKLNDTIQSLIEVTKTQKNLNRGTEAVSLKEVLEDVKEEIAGMIQQTGAIITDSFAVPELTIAKASLRSIIYNLLSNALKYHSPQRQPHISFSSAREEDMIVLSVKDNGLGLTESQQSKLFSMFKRFHTHVEGTGIGLYIVKRTMENINGRITVNSKLNEGTAFKLYFTPDLPPFADDSLVPTEL